MANGKIRFGKQSGGELALVIPDGATNTEVTLPESGTVATTSNIVGFKNYIINGDMRIDQWNNGALVNVTGAGAIAPDRFQHNATQTGKITAQQRVSAAVAMGDAQFENCLQILTTSGYSPTTSDQFIVGQKIEGLNIANLRFGKSNAKKITLSFWVRSSVVGLHCVSFRNSAVGRSYVATYTINTANTFEYKTITINGDTSGTWLYDTGIGLRIVFNLASGSTYTTSTPNQWVNGSYSSTTGVVNDIATTGNEFTITGIQLEEGSVATPFENRPYGLELSLCQRYYEKVDVGRCNIPIYGTGTGFIGSVKYKVPKRASPTISLGATSHWRTMGIYSGVSLSTLNVQETTMYSFDVNGTSSAGNITAGGAGKIQVMDGYTDNGTDGIFVSAEL